MFSARASVRFTPSSIVALAAFLLCGCPKQEWHYTPPPAPAPSKDFDVHIEATQLDPNGVPRNLDWQSQLQGHLPSPDNCNDGQPYSSACTQDKPFQDQPSGIHEAFCFIGKAASGSPIQPFYGHADWMVAQFNGSIGWYNFGDDWDYDLFLIPGSDHLPPAPPAPFNEHGITTNNNHVSGDQSPQYIEMEFDSNETESAFTKGWWNDFRMNGEANNVAEIAELFHPGQKTLACGSVVGLFGLDCDHGCRSELHPIYGLAIQRTEDPSDNEWSVMARNWGTGGYCSQYNDELAESNISLILPYNSSQPPTSVEVKEFASAANISTAQIGCPTMYFQNGQTVVNLTLPPPEQQPVAAFTLKIQWPSGAEPVACTQLPPSAAAIMSLSPEQAPKPGPMRGEDYMGALVRASARSQNPNVEHPFLEKDILPGLPKFQTRMQALKKMTLAPPVQPCERLLTVKSGMPQPAPPPTTHKIQIDPSKRVRDDAIRNYVCHNYKARNFALPAGTTQQDLDQACKGIK